MTYSLPAQLHSLKTMTVSELKSRWRTLFETEPPPYNRAFLESRLVYRIQELAIGGLSPQTVKRLEALSNELDAGKASTRKAFATDRPIAGTRLVREWQGVEHTVTVLVEGFEYQGKPYKALSPIAKAITGSNWNGKVFFGLKSQQARS